ncbi:MAG: hypothetical protein HUU35_12670 [Armatimonadetes bacterium]|nr:hypothetical protein [Armatimonadota bacterium]
MTDYVRPGLRPAVLITPSYLLYLEVACVCWYLLFVALHRTIAGAMLVLLTFPLVLIGSVLLLLRPKDRRELSGLVVTPGQLTLLQRQGALRRYRAVGVTATGTRAVRVSTSVTGSASRPFVLRLPDPERRDEALGILQSPPPIVLPDGEPSRLRPTVPRDIRVNHQLSHVVGGGLLFVVWLLAACWIRSVQVNPSAPWLRLTSYYASTVFIIGMFHFQWVVSPWFKYRAEGETCLFSPAEGGPESGAILASDIVSLHVRGGQTLVIGRDYWLLTRALPAKAREFAAFLAARAGLEPVAPSPPTNSTTPGATR